MVTVSNCRDLVLHFSGLYILAAVTIRGKMYKLKNCLNWCRRMLTVIPATWQVPARPRQWIANLILPPRMPDKPPLYPFRCYHITLQLKAPPRPHRTRKKGPTPKCRAQHTSYNRFYNVNNEVDFIQKYIFDFVITLVQTSHDYTVKPIIKRDFECFIQYGIHINRAALFS